MKITFCGPDLGRLEDARQALSDNGIEEGDPILFANMGRLPPEHPDARVGIRSKLWDLTQKLEENHRVMIDWEPVREEKMLPWHGRSEPVEPAVIERFGLLVNACKVLLGPTGVYGFPGNWIHQFPSVSETAFDAMHELNFMSKPDLWFPQLYMQHQATDEIPYNEGGQKGEHQATRICEVLRKTIDIAGSPNKVIPVYQSHIERKDSEWHLSVLSERTVRLWFRAVKAMGIREVCWWTDNERNLAEIVAAQAPIIKAVIDES